MRETGDLQKTIASTIGYYQVFRYYLNLQELFLYLHTETPISKNEIEDFVGEKKWQINDYLISCLEIEKETTRRKRQRHKLVNEQKRRFIESGKKMRLAEGIVNLLKIIPSVRLIAVSGNLAMMNAAKDDDIDLFVVVAAGTVWTTRLLCTLLLITLGKKRFFGERKVKDKACLNFLVDEENLTMRKKNIYTAHELAQMKLLFDVDGTYRRLLQNNLWAKKYLGNWWLTHSENIFQNNLFEEERNLFFKLITRGLRWLEPAARVTQYGLMRRRLTREVVDKGVLKFHPRDDAQVVMRKYKLNLKRMAGIV